MGSWGGELSGQHAYVAGRWSWTGGQARVESAWGASLAIYWVGDPHRPVVGRCCWVAQPRCSIHCLTKVGRGALGKLKMQSRTLRKLVGSQILPGRCLVLLDAAAAAREQVQAQ